MYTLNASDVASIGVALNRPGHIKDSAAREIARLTVQASKEEAARAEAERAARHDGYDKRDNCDNLHNPCGACRVCELLSIHWPRARAVRNAIAVTKTTLSRHRDKHDDFSLTLPEYHDVLIRQYRLYSLAARVNARSASVGNFPISRRDQRVGKSRFLRSAVRRFFDFRGGREDVLFYVTPEDLLQGGYARAIENGDTVNGVPTYGALFAHIQAERASLRKIELAERAAFSRVMHGDVPTVSESWPEMTDKHSMRLLGTGKHASLDQHRESLAIAHRDAEMANIDDAVTASARAEALESTSSTALHVIVARLLEAGATLDQLAESQGLTSRTFEGMVRESADAALLPLESGIDHAERSLDLHYAAEREREQDAAEERHAERLRGIRVATEVALYAASRAA